MGPRARAYGLPRPSVGARAYGSGPTTGATPTGRLRPSADAMAIGGDGSFEGRRPSPGSATCTAGAASAYWKWVSEVSRMTVLVPAYENRPVSASAQVFGVNCCECEIRPVRL